MSKDPTKNPSPPESLEAAVYRATLSEGNASVRRASPWVTIPVTIAMYLVCGEGVWLLAKTSKAVQNAVKKTVGIDLSEQKEEDAPPPPPPPPPAPAPMAPPRAPEKSDAPPPPPLTNQETVPDLAPRELPKEDLSLRYAQASSGNTGATGVQGATGPALNVAGAGGGKVMEYDFSQVTVKYQPPAPAYPAIARIAKIQGTVKVEITVGTDGVPIKATAIEGPPQLRPTAENYAMHWRFEPALMNGVPISVRFVLTMPFRLH